MFKHSTSDITSELLEDLLEEAGQSKEKPPDPLGGIPPQKLPHWLRCLIKYLILPFVLFDLTMQKLARLIIRPPFKKEGSCLKRGNCCHYILVRFSNTFFGKLFYWWSREINGFYLRYKEPQLYEGKSMYVMGCRYLKKNGKCSVYYVRPLVCRQWPLIEHFGYPRILKGCGFRSNPPYPPDLSQDVFVETNESTSLKILQ